MAAEDGPQHLENEEVARQLELRFGTLQDGIYARLVEKVGDKMYWENQAKSVGEIAQKFIERIALLIKENENARNYFKEFISGLHKNINDSIDEGQAIEMLAFRWASDRIAQCPDGGIVAFITNGSWLDGNAQDGMRKCMAEEFDKIYVYNLRGNQRTSGELSRKEGGKIFGSGSRPPITITILVKKARNNA